MGYKSIEVRREHGRKYYAEHREQVLEKQRIYDLTKRDKEKQRETKRKYYWSHRDKIRTYQAAKRKLKQKHGYCEICEQYRKLVYDHDHSTNAFRGWICTQCNVALGMVKDNKEILCKMIKYLQER
jgi:ribosomal protein L34